MVSKKYTVLLDGTKCMENSRSERYDNKLLILDPKMLRSEFQKPYFQYFYATGGFGCKPDSLGRKVYGRFLATGEEAQFFRSDFLGIADTEQLPKWAAERLTQLQTPKMKIRIFQIDHYKAQNDIAYEGYDHAVKDGKVDSSIYRQIYGGTVNCKDLEEVFALCNTDHPPGYYGESLSVSNVIEICDGDKKGFYYCDTVGFKPVEFDISKTNRNELLKVLIVENGKEPYTAEIRNCLEAKQSVVGGLIEPVYFTDTEKVLVYCDEEFLLKGYMPNRMVGETVIHGTFMVVGDDFNDEGECVEVSLTDSQCEKYSEMFRIPMIYLTRSEAEEMCCDESEEAPDIDISQS